MNINKNSTCHFSISADPIVAEREIRIVIHKMDIKSKRYGVRIVK
jgi:hypothetical protein